MKRRSAGPIVPELSHHQRIQQRLADLACLREARRVRPPEAVIAELTAWLPSDCWPAVEEAIRSRDHEQVELPADFLETFARLKQEAGIEVARKYEADTLRRIALGSVVPR